MILKREGKFMTNKERLAIFNLPKMNNLNR